MKALWIKRNASTPPKVHRYDRLAAFLGAPPQVRDAARLLGVVTWHRAIWRPRIEQFDNTDSQENLQTTVPEGFANLRSGMAS